MSKKSETNWTSIIIQVVIAIATIIVESKKK